MPSAAETERRLHPICRESVAPDFEEHAVERSRAKDDTCRPRDGGRDAVDPHRPGRCPELSVVCAKRRWRDQLRLRQLRAMHGGKSLVQPQSHVPAADRSIAAAARRAQNSWVIFHAESTGRQSKDVGPDGSAYAGDGHNVVRERASEGANPLEVAFSLPCRQLSLQGLAFFAKDVAASTGGNLEITMHPGAALYRAPEIKRAVQIGQAQMGEAL